MAGEAFHQSAGEGRETIPQPRTKIANNGRFIQRLQAQRNKQHIGNRPLNHIYKHSERGFEIVTSYATAILSNSITFILAMCMVAYWWTDDHFFTQDVHARIGDIIFGVTFLYLFIIQKSFNHFSASLHIKINELVASHHTASNAVMNVEKKTEEEILELSKDYTELAEQTAEDGKKIEELKKTIEQKQ
jgi:low affinity Fe/Cu permease